MRRIIFSMGISIDGFMEGPNREIDWHLVDEELHEHFNEWLGGMSVFLEGRITYELMEGFWPAAEHDPASTPVMLEFARIWAATPKVVFSRTLGSAGPNARLVREVAADEIQRLKEEPGGDMVVGGADLAAEFMRQDLVDEYRVYVHPVLIGQGRPMFLPSDVRRGLRLIETRVFGNGVVLLRYSRAAAG